MKIAHFNKGNSKFKNKIDESSEVILVSKVEMKSLSSLFFTENFTMLSVTILKSGGTVTGTLIML